MTHRSSIAWILFFVIFFATALAMPFFYLMVHTASEDLCHRGCLDLGWPESEITDIPGRYKCYCIKNYDVQLYWDILEEARGDGEEKNDEESCEEIKIVCDGNVIESVCGRNWIVVGNQVDLTNCSTESRESRSADGCDIVIGKPCS